MNYGNFVGRIGALAVALGVGSAIAAPAGIAWASPDTTTDAPSVGSQGADTTESPSTGDKSATQPGGTKASPSAPTTSATTDVDKGSSDTVAVTPGVTVSSSGGAQSSTHGTGSKADHEPTDGAAGQADASGKSHTAPAIAQSHNKFRDSGTSSATAVSSAPAPKPTPPTLAHNSGRSTTVNDAVAPSLSLTSAKVPATGTITATQLSVSTTASTIMTPPAPSPIETTITSVLNNVVAPVLSSFLTALQRGLTESPLAWMFLAAARREVGTEAVAEVAPTAMRMAATQVVATAVVNQAPTAVGTFSTANPVTGAVTGKVVATDPEGTTPTITLTTTPTAGTLVYNATAATFTYTPTAAQRILAGSTPWASTIAMTVTVSDGVNNVPVQINIPVSAVVVGVRADVTGVGGAGAVAATNTRAYVTNRDAGTVTVIDTTTAKVIGTWAVGSTPDGVAVKQDGTRLYVSSSAGNTVKVIDTATGAVTATIAVA
ncbi:MAG: large repetitive protein [Mycobacterium sp.]|nr:large repetitive protein [Mycobacterium sp.]